MASNFYIVHHEFRVGTSSKLWKNAYVAMAPGGGGDKAITANIEKGFYNHSANAVTSDGPVYCIWETKEKITVEEFQEFIDVPTGTGFGLNALMNICKPIDTSLMKGHHPYQRVFS